MILWLIDDTLQHHGTAEATAGLVPGVDFAGFISGADALEAFRAVHADPARAPEVVLMDFYLGDERGDRLTSHFRQLEHAIQRPVIIGYSSVPSASEAIIAAGGDLMLRKLSNDDGINPVLLDWLQRFMATRKIP